MPNLVIENIQGKLRLPLFVFCFIFCLCFNLAVTTLGLFFLHRLKNDFEKSSLLTSQPKRTQQTLSFLMLVKLLPSFTRGVKFDIHLCQIAPNGKNLGLFKISFSTFWLAEPKCRKTDLIKSQIFPIWGQSDPIWMRNLTSLIKASLSGMSCLASKWARLSTNWTNPGSF